MGNKISALLRISAPLGSKNWISASSADSSIYSTRSLCFICFMKLRTFESQRTSSTDDDQTNLMTHIKTRGWLDLWILRIDCNGLDFSAYGISWEVTCEDHSRASLSFDFQSQIFHSNIICVTYYIRSVSGSDLMSHFRNVQKVLDALSCLRWVKSHRKTPTNQYLH